MSFTKDPLRLCTTSKPQRTMDTPPCARWLRSHTTSHGACDPTVNHAGHTISKSCCGCLAPHKVNLGPATDDPGPPTRKVVGPYLGLTPRALVGPHPLGQGSLPWGNLLRGIQGRPGPGCLEGACPQEGFFGQEVAPNQGPRGEAQLGPN